MKPDIKAQGAEAPARFEPYIRPFIQLRDKIGCALNERKIDKLKQELASFGPGCINLGRFEEFCNLSAKIAADERLGRVELLRIELEMLINHVMTLQPWWGKGALEKYTELSNQIDQLDEKNLADVNAIARELNKHARATLRDTTLDLMN